MKRTAQPKSFVKKQERKARKLRKKQARNVPRDVPRETPTEYVEATLSLPRPVFNVLARAAEIAGMQHAQISLAIVALALARAEQAAQARGALGD